MIPTHLSVFFTAGAQVSATLIGLLLDQIVQHWEEALERLRQFVEQSEM